MQPAHSLQISKLCCTRGDRQLFDGLAFTLRNGELLHLAGHNGSGKTTLMRTVAGLLSATHGEILWDSKPIHRSRSSYQAELCYLGHLNSLKGDLNAVENLRIHFAICGEALEENKIWQTLREIGLKGHEDIPGKYLSQGQKRRVALARLWLTKATLWILDEPFSALDVAAVAQLQSRIREHLTQGGMVILTTHQKVELLSDNLQTLTLGQQHA
jgi:heme exporter protein A